MTTRPVRDRRERHGLGRLAWALCAAAEAIAVVGHDALSPGALRALLIVFMGLWPLGDRDRPALAVQLFPAVAAATLAAGGRDDPMRPSCGTLTA